MIDASHFLRESDGTWSTGFAFDDSGELAKLTVRSEATAVPATHLRAVVELARRWPDARRSLTPALWAFYLRVEAMATDASTRIDNAEGVWQNLSLSDVEVVLDGQGRVLRLHGFGRCEWEAEHGLEIVVSPGGDPIYVGPYEGWRPEDLDKPDDWNFARIELQQEVLSKLRPTQYVRQESARDTELLNRQPSAGHRAIAHSKPWWKFW